MGKTKHFYPVFLMQKEWGMQTEGRKNVVFSYHPLYTSLWIYINTSLLQYHMTDLPHRADDNTTTHVPVMTKKKDVRKIH